MEKAKNSWKGPASNRRRRCSGGKSWEAGNVPTESAQKKDLTKYVHTRSSACAPAVAGTHAPWRSKWAVGSRRWLGGIINAVSSCRGCKGSKTMPCCGRIDATHDPGGVGGLDSIVCELWRPWWLTVNNVREVSACARPRTVKVSPPHRSTQSFKENHLFFVAIELWSALNTKSLSRRDFNSG